MHRYAGTIKEMQKKNQEIMDIQQKFWNNAINI